MFHTYNIFILSVVFIIVKLEAKSIAKTDINNVDPFSYLVKYGYIVKGDNTTQDGKTSNANNDAQVLQLTVIMKIHAKDKKYN